MTTTFSNSPKSPEPTGISKELPDAGDCNLIEIPKTAIHVGGSCFQSQAAGDGSNLNLDESAPENKISPASRDSSSLGSVDGSNDYIDEIDPFSTPRSITSASNPENKTNLIVNYLPPNVSQEDVRILFTKMGEVESCKLVRGKSTGESLGYAFVRFSHPSDAEKAIEKINGLKLQNKTIKVSLARPSCESIKGANLYICGLPKSVTTHELENLFKSCGNIITTRILCDQKTSTSRGVAFIRFDKRCEAKQAIKKLNGYTFPDTNEVMMVKFANSPGSHSDGRSSISSRSTTTSTGFIREKHSPLPKPPSRRQSKYCGTEDLCDETATQQIAAPGVYQTQIPQFYGFGQPNIGPSFPVQPGMPFPPFRTFGNEYAMPQIMGHPRIFQHPLWQGTQMGFCRLPSSGYFQRPTALSKIMQTPPPAGVVTTGVPLNNPLITASQYNEQPTRSYPVNEDLNATTKALLGPAYAANSGALSSNGWCIFVYNLGPDTEDAVLWQLFGPFGAVHAVKVVIDPMSGKCKGFGFVTMSNYDEASKAILALSGFNLDGRILQVSFKPTTKLNEPFRQYHRNFNVNKGPGGNRRPTNSGNNNMRRRIRHQVA